MKKVNLVHCFTMLALSSLTFLLSSCTKDSLRPSAAATSAANEVASSQSYQTTTTTTASLSPGTYKVLKFIEKYKDETAQFKGYTFNFKADGVLIATTASGQVVKGKWWLNSTKTKLSIDISGTENLNDIDEDNWKVLTLNTTTIKLSIPEDPVTIEFVKIY